ncbi:hypothetical protein D3C87_1414190 [compost metagenome]
MFGESSAVALKIVAESIALHPQRARDINRFSIPQAAGERHQRNTAGQNGEQNNRDKSPGQAS